MSYFVEGNTPLFSLQISIFAQELPHYEVLLGFDAAEVTEAVEDAAYMAWVVKCDATVAKYKLGWKSFEGLTREGSADVLVLTPPAAPVFDVMPLLVKPGVQKRFTQKAAKAKANKDCSEDIQKILGIYTTPGAVVTIAPDLKVKEEAGYPLLSFHKHGRIAINLYRNTGTGYDSKPYKTLTKSPFLDTDLPAIGVAGHFKYKGIYVVNDIETGSFSPEISINVVGR